MSILDSLITDRTAADLARWLELRNKGYANMTDAEKAEWDAADMKGAYNASDLNRVGEALNYVHDRLSDFGFLPVGTFTARTDWAIGEIPTALEFAAYLKYVDTVREALFQFDTTPPTPTNTGRLSYTEANDIERIILDINQLLENIGLTWYFLGDLYLGEV